MMTFEQAVAQAEQRLTQADLYHGHGMHNAYDEAVYAAQFCADLSVALEPDWQAAYPETAQARLNQLITARCERKVPLAYLTH